MNTTLFLKEFKKNMTSLLIWMAVITLLITVTMSVFRTFMENQSKITGMLTLLPKGALQFKGVSNISDLLSVLGFYAANNVIYMMVLGSIYAIVLSSNIVLKEEYNKTAEYLLTRPVSRSEIFISKMSVVVLNVLLLNFVTALAGFICIEVVKTGPFSIPSFMFLSIYTLLLNMLFAAIGIFMSTLVKRAKPVTTFAIGMVMIFYFIYTISKITESISKLGYISPFRYVDMSVISAGHKLNILNLAYFLGISILLTILSFRIYLRKDIYT
jgi:ABC-2 type transport system permease protein